MRTDLGEGWYLITDDVLLSGDLAALEAYGRKMATEPPAVHLEGPGGMQVMVPLDGLEDAFAALGIKRKRRLTRRKSGPRVRADPTQIVVAIWRRHDKTTKPPRATEIAGDVGYADVASLYRRIPGGLTFTKFRDLALRAKAETQRLAAAVASSAGFEWSNPADL